MTQMSSESKRWRKLLDRDLDRLDRTKSALARKRDYYGSAGFAQNLALGQTSSFWDRHQSEYWQAVESYRGSDLELLLSEISASLMTELHPHLYGRTDVTVGYVGSGQLRALLTGSASLLEFDINSIDLNGLIKRVDFVLVGYPSADIARSETASNSVSDSFREMATAVVEKCRQYTVPVVLLLPDASSGFTELVEFASQFDLVATLDDVSADRLETALPSSQTVIRVDPFFSPIVHSPVGRNRERLDAALYWGQFPARNQKGRRDDLHKLFEGVLFSGVPLTIASSEFLDGARKQSTLPWQFASSVIPLPNAKFEPGYRRLFDYHVLSNLKPGSQWGYAMETLPVIASGSIPLSTYSVGLNNHIPSIVIPDGIEDVRLELGRLREDSTEFDSVQSLGVRTAFNSFTADKLIDALFAQLSTLPNKKKILVNIEVEEAGASQSQFLSEQTLPDDVVVVGPGQQADLQFNLREGVRYGQYAVADVVNGFRMTSADALTFPLEGRPAEYVYDFYPSHKGPHDAVWLGRSGDRKAYSERQPAVTFSLGRGSATSESREQIDLNRSAANRSGFDGITVVVPVYNNGRHLESKCFRSLRRSSIFDQMRILLIDDGSTDEETVRIVENLARRYANVETYMFPKGGSGSASRPRNQGLDMATTEYITYLDPDNEATGDGYARLLELCKSTNVDFAIGNMVRLAKSRTLIDNVGVLRKAIDFDEGGVGQVDSNVLPAINYQPMSIQALVARVDWLRNTGISQPLGALGQDSLFFQMMLHAAASIAVLDEPIHSYYGEVAGSMVNTIGPSFFRKYLPLEEMRSEWLRSEGLWEHYSQNRALAFLRVWFWPRFNERVSIEDKEECFAVLLRLAGMYGIRISMTSDGHIVEGGSRE